jgi:hypothetical protein
LNPDTRIAHLNFERPLANVTVNLDSRKSTRSA